MSKKRLLITGIPGVGKTRIGRFLQEKYSYVYENVEAWPDRDEKLCIAPQNPDATLIDSKIRTFVEGKDNVVADFGFRPESKVDVAIVERLKEKWGFRLFWFDGNRGAALREYFKRELPEYETQGLKDFYDRIGGFFRQVQCVDSTGVCHQINPLCTINPFKVDNTFKSEEEIWQEITRHIY